MKDYLCAAFLPSDFSYQRDIASLSRRSNSIPKSLYRFPCDIHRVPLAPLSLLPASRSLEACCGLEDMDVWRSGGALQASRRGGVEVLAFERRAHRGPKW